jgi:ribosomal-protein-alanine N-acetyltransferase
MYVGTIARAEPAETQEAERLFADARFTFLRAWLANLGECARSGLLFTAQHRGRGRAALACSSQNPDVFNLCGAAFLHEMDVDAFLVPLLQTAIRSLGETGASFLTYVGTEDWLVPRLVRAGFSLKESVITLMKTGGEVPAHPRNPAIRVRRGEEADLCAVVRLDQEAFPAEWHYGEATLLRALRAAHVFLVAHTGSIIGYAYGDVMGGSAHLTRLAISPRHQGHGVGAALLREAMLLFQERGAWSVTLNTQRSNAASQQLYQRFGFQPIGQSVPLLVQRLMREESAR